MANKMLLNKKINTKVRNIKLKLYEKMRGINGK